MTVVRTSRDTHLNIHVGNPQKAGLITFTMADRHTKRPFAVLSNSTSTRADPGVPGVAVYYHRDQQTGLTCTCMSRTRLAP